MHRVEKGNFAIRCIDKEVYRLAFSVADVLMQRDGDSLSILFPDGDRIVFEGFYSSKGVMFIMDGQEITARDFLIAMNAPKTVMPAEGEAEDIAVEQDGRVHDWDELDTLTGIFHLDGLDIYTELPRYEDDAEYMALAEDDDEARLSANATVTSPDTPDKPVEPSQPVEPEKPVEPKPDNPKPVEPEKPIEPKPDEPDKPDTPGPEGPDKPDNPKPDEPEPEKPRPPVISLVGDADEATLNGRKPGNFSSKQNEDKGITMHTANFDIENEQAVINNSNQEVRKTRLIDVLEEEEKKADYETASYETAQAQTVAQTVQSSSYNEAATVQAESAGQTVDTLAASAENIQPQATLAANTLAVNVPSETGRALSSFYVESQSD